MFSNKSVSAHSFAMVPRSDIPRSSLRMERALKTTFNAGYLVPIFCEEILPGDTWRVKMTAFGRLATPLFPVMDNLHLESFFFFVPNRLVWSNWQRFMGEQLNPGDSISYVVPQTVCPVNGFAVGSVFDYFGLPTVGQVGAGNVVAVNCLPLRAYNLIFNQWFRDENIVASAGVSVSDGPDAYTLFDLFKRGKRHDYFTSALPWPQKGGTSVSIPLGTRANVYAGVGFTPAIGTGMTWVDSGTGSSPTSGFAVSTGTGSGPYRSTTAATQTGNALVPNNLYADLSTATAATINQLRQSFQIQAFLEKDARGGTRYTEIIRSHFGVVSPDARLQRPEYLGGGHSAINIAPIAQQSATGVTGSTTPVGTLSAMGTTLAMGHGFSQSFTEHGYVIGLVNVRADLTYQQGLRKMWSRSTRYDFYFPVFASLGEQAVLNKEIYCTGAAGDANVFGYQERWAEYRFLPSQITGLFRSTSAGTIDPWHLAQRFTTTPVLDATFIEENPPLSRVLAVGAAANGQQLLFDAFFECITARPMPVYSIPYQMSRF